MMQSGEAPFAGEPKSFAFALIEHDHSPALSHSRACIYLLPETGLIWRLWGRTTGGIGMDEG